MILYEIHIGYRILIPIIIATLSLLFFLCFFCYNGYKKKRQRIYVVISVAILMLGYAAAVTLIILADVLDYIGYKNGNYMTVEGYVTNFKDSVEDTKGRGYTFEEFEINGVKFKYEENVITGGGYRKTRRNGGVIKGDGQYLRIGYIPGINFNSILYIAEPPFDKIQVAQSSYLYELRFLILLIIAVIGGGIFFACYKRKRITVDYNKSYIDDYTADNDNIIIRCKIRLNNTFKDVKRIRLYGNFRKEKQLGIIDNCMLKGVLSDLSVDYIEVPVGITEYLVNFIGKADKNNIDDLKSNNLSCILPKIKIQIVA